MLDRTFHQAAFDAKPKNHASKPSTFWVAVLRANLTPSNIHREEDFLWIKCHSGIKVKIIRTQYLNKYRDDGDIVLKLDSQTPADESMRNLDFYHDQLIAFEAVKVSEIPARIPVQRQPLGQSINQLGKPEVPQEHPHVSHVEDKYPSRRFGSSSPIQDENIKLDAETCSSKNSSRNVAGRTYSQPNSPSSCQNLASVKMDPAPNPTYSRTLSTPFTEAKAQDEDTRTPPQIKDTLGSLNDNKPFHEFDLTSSNGFAQFEAEWRLGTEESKPSLDPTQVRSLLVDRWIRLSSAQRKEYENRSSKTEENAKVELNFIKHEPDLKNELSPDMLPVGFHTGGSQRERIFQPTELLRDATPESLESSVTEGLNLLETLKQLMLNQQPETSDTAQWIQQIDNLKRQAVKTKTIVGVVGNTGAGKSSVINAVLDEERLLPTNCMRACTAVVTELSYNDSEIPYRAQIEFIKPADWEKELKILFEDLLDGNGEVSRESSNADTDAGVAYAKIKAVYPKKSKHEIARSSINQMLREVTHILGSTRNINETDSLKFYQRLQHFVDSKEKSTGEKDKDRKKERKEMEFWPLIRVVRIFVKSQALSTGAVVVDLPGVHDSNAARAAVAERYMKDCTGLWIVAPITRAVDDKAAKSLLGESFKRQLKMDGGFSNVTFICSKTDDISIMEAQEALDLTDSTSGSWQKIQEATKKQKALTKELRGLKDAKAVFGEALDDVDEQLEVWESLQDAIDDGETVFAPADKSSKKRRREDGHRASRKKRRILANSEGSDVDEEGSLESSGLENSEEEDNADSCDQKRPLSGEQISAKINELRTTKKEARSQRLELNKKLEVLKREIDEVSAEEEKLLAEMSASCISGRNQYSKGAIQQDFATGLKELDQELAAEEDEENFNPDVEIRDYDDVARSLPVFCVSSRAYQKLRGRLQQEPNVPGFRSLDETEIPQLQSHCRQLTEKGRIADCTRFINNLSQLLNSLTLWASNDGTRANLTLEQWAGEENHLQKGLRGLESALNKVVEKTCKELIDEFQDNIFDKYETATKTAVKEASNTARHWGAPVNREARSEGGYHWSTYKAICRRNGVYSNAQGPHEWNYQLIEPMMKQLASGWEKTFCRRLPSVMMGFARDATNALRDFHRGVSDRTNKLSSATAGLHMLHQQLANYENLFKDLGNHIKDTISNAQKEINREFTPVIERAMSAAYQACRDENGPGSYARMKAAMSRHVDQERHVMFQDSADEARSRLKGMMREVEETMSNRVDEVFVAMRTDYSAALGSNHNQGEILPRQQRLLRNEVMGIIEGVEKSFRGAFGQEIKDDNGEQEEEARPMKSEADEPIADQDQCYTIPSLPPISELNETQGFFIKAASAGAEPEAIAVPRNTGKEPTKLSTPQKAQPPYLSPCSNPPVQEQDPSPATWLENHCSNAYRSNHDDDSSSSAYSKGNASDSNEY